MASAYSYMFFSLFLILFITSQFSYARNPKGQLDLSARFLPRTQAERQIRGLNLFPKHAINKPAFDEDELSGKFGHYAGYYRLSHTKAARMFYYFFESRSNKNDPVVIWLTGGPGCSSELALFYENGPFNIANNLSLSWNDYGWDKASNIIFVDQPTGTGFSYTTAETDIRHDENGVSNDLYDFLQAFFKEHPQLAKNEFYITGESYAGHYIPAFASRVHQGNKKKEGIHINLKGFAIGNGLTQPEIQYKAYTDYALDNKLIEKTDYDSINEMIPDCERAIKSCGNDGVSTCEDAFGVCNNIFQSILQIAGDINYYDIRKTCEGSLCYDFSKMETFLNQKTVRDALGVGDIEFVSCSSVVYDAMTRDWMRNLAVGIPALLEDGIKVLIYAGEEDLICNWLGNSREAGQLKSHGPLSFLKVHNAGHMVPMDQPKAALEMLKSWMQGKLAATGTRDWISPQ
ncbi:SERINE CARBOXYPEPTIDASE-LIKE 48-RELATED [Salix purpurea]|uniref:Carboxypeptidase n=1 Tax=Salix purpurea TaxID=77065 RepID=A0A9Q0WE35_SALPP|nr:SERINE CARBOXYPEPTIDASE-LIKE 48-RELATED [Salix purpurea]